MMMPSVRDSFFRGFMNPFDDLFDFSKSFFDGSNQNVLKTDIKEANGNYELEMELPGYQKADINAKLENGYLTVQAKHKEEKDEKNEEGNYIRRERYQGMVSRSFYVGESVKQEDINASFEQGVLHLTIPKAAIVEKENQGYIRIEG